MTDIGNGKGMRWLRAALKMDTDECLDWPYSTEGVHPERQYGTLYIGRRRVATHVALELDGRPQPSPHLMALHSCDRPICVNPRHLRWGTRAENARDMVERGRNPYNKGGRKLTDAQVQEVRSRQRSRNSAARWAAEFGVTASAIRDLLRGDTHRDLIA